jgi:MarR family transcriptional regulator, multiple antibiotic resistance protein MarR
LAEVSGAPTASGGRVAESGASAFLDVVGLVTEAVWADLRRSGAAIEPTQWATLRLLSSSALTISELARAKAVSLPTMSKSVDMLARRGWVERCADDADRRQTLVRLTADGRRILAACRRRFEDLLAVKLATLDRESHDALVAGLLAVRDVLRNAP